MPPSNPFRTTCFSRDERLRKSAEYARLSADGTKARSPHFLVIRGPVGEGGPRLGITASRKVGNAVVRNRIKRLVREFFRLNKGLFVGADYNVVARPGAGELEFSVFCRELAHVIGRR